MCISCCPKRAIIAPKKIKNEVIRCNYPWINQQDGWKIFVEIFGFQHFRKESSVIINRGSLTWGSVGVCWSKGSVTSILCTNITNDSYLGTHNFTNKIDSQTHVCLRYLLEMSLRKWSSSALGPCFDLDQGDHEEPRQLLLVHQRRLRKACRWRQCIWSSPKPTSLKEGPFRVALWS